ncbi:MAG: SDR family oxidoreductase [Planctomycetes bacterium]|nr:SDR family oxidoreductase [Planctomycetota bacterium]
MTEDPVQGERPHLKILILGGTGFIGPHEVDAALQRGHEVTLFNRGKRNPGLFPELETLLGDRDPDKDEGLKALEGRSWDVVIDNSGYYPRHVKASAELLAPSVRQYIFISSISAYADNSTEGQDETAVVATMPDPAREDMGENYEYYGALKALCEQAAQEAMQGRATIVRPGYIVGPGDYSHRFTYWPLRVRGGGEVAVPGDPEDPVQVIDGRDLAEWVVHLAEENTTGVFNACGPAARLTMKEVVGASKRVTGSDATFTWLDLAFLEGQSGVNFPIWSPHSGATKGDHCWSNARAIEVGLTFRPLETTIKDLLTWFDEQPEELRTKVMANIPRKNEPALLEAWRAREKE